LREFVFGCGVVSVEGVNLVHHVFLFNKLAVLFSLFFVSSALGGCAISSVPDDVGAVVPGHVVPVEAQAAEESLLFFTIYRKKSTITSSH
jgi:hypothetical protein